MAKKRIGSEDERLDDASIERVIKYLEDKKATKKGACNILNIAYNTTRLDKLIETYLQRKEANARRRAEKRGKPATKEEIGFVISEYLDGNTISGISNALFRGTTFVNSILEDYAVPERNSSPDYFHPCLIPDEAVRERFALKEKVYSARYDCMAEIENELFQNNQYVYRVYLRGTQNMFAYQPASELASLQKLREAGFLS
jgi:hypothetical protein